MNARSQKAKKEEDQLIEDRPSASEHAHLLKPLALNSLGLFPGLSDEDLEKGLSELFDT